ncbi:MAG: RNA polymerase sigma factor, partial [Gemmataceae bacterium]
MEPLEPSRFARLYYYARMQLPTIPLTAPTVRHQLDRTFQYFRSRQSAPETTTWTQFLTDFYLLDWYVCVGCLERVNAAWDRLFAARTGRSDCLLVESLHSRAVRLFPRNEDRQMTAVSEFWSRLLVPESENSTPILARYDGHRPLAPWLIRVFQNQQLSELRRQTGEVSLVQDDDHELPLPSRPVEADRWHDLFTHAAQTWLESLNEAELILLGLRWRYRLSQREVAHILGVHEGTISRQNDRLRDRALELF